MLSDFALEGVALIEANRSKLIIACLLCALLHKLVIYPFFLSPLRNIPGPYAHRVTRLIALNNQRKARWTSTVHQLHKKYGSVVILSPTEISVNGDSKYISDIYVKNFPKTSFYAQFKNHGEDNMFATMDNDLHLSYKKMVMGLYSKSAIFNPNNTSRSILVEKIGHLVSRVYKSSVTGQKPDLINARSENNPHGKGHNSAEPWFNLCGKTKNLGIDVYSLFGSLALDAVSAFEVGNGNGTDLLLHPEKTPILVSHRLVASMGFWTTLMPRFWNWAATPAILKASAELEKWQLGIYENAEDNVPISRPGENLTTLESFKKQGFRGTHAYSFLSDNIFAGHETTAIQLTYLFYELSRPTNMQLRDMLHNELVEHFGTPKSPNDVLDNFEIIDKLPILDAVLQENSRVHTSIPGAEPRVTNCNYPIKLDDGQEIVLPQGTAISCQPYSMHRVETVFSNPDEFLPQRWLRQATETETDYGKRMKLQQKYMMPFGKGIRMCLGMNLALIEMKLAIANLYWHFYTKICPDWCDVVEKGGVIQMGNQAGENKTDMEKMVMYDTYTTRPYNDECWLEFYEY